MPEKQEQKQKLDRRRHNKVLSEKAIAAQWKPGQSGNPNGRPRIGQSLVNRIREMGKELIHSKDGQTVMSRLDILLLRAWNDAMAGNKDARQFIVERGWGKVPLTVNTQSIGDELEQRAIELGIAIEEHRELAVIVGAARIAEHRIAIAGSDSSTEKSN